MGKNKHKKKYIDEYFMRKHYEQKCEQLEHDLNAANNEIKSLMNALLERDKMIKLLKDNLDLFTPRPESPETHTDSD